MPKVKMVCGDTMNYWIKDHTANLKAVLKELDVLLINDGEARMLSGETNAVKAAEKVLALGPKSLVVKHGEYGATAFFGDRSFFGAKSVPRPFRAPALPLAEGRGPDRRGRFVCWPDSAPCYLASQPEIDPCRVSAKRCSTVA